jgi:hypothetical protein
MHAPDQQAATTNLLENPASAEWDAAKQEQSNMRLQRFSPIETSYRTVSEMFSHTLKDLEMDMTPKGVVLSLRHHHVMCPCVPWVYVLTSGFLWDFEQWTGSVAEIYKSGIVSSKSTPYTNITPSLHILTQVLRSLLCGYAGGRIICQHPFQKKVEACIAKAGTYRFLGAAFPFRERGLEGGVCHAWPYFFRRGAKMT